MPYRPAPSVHKLTSKTDYCPRWVAECMRAGRDRVRTTLFGELPRSEIHTKSWLCISSYSKALLRKLDNRASARVDSRGTLRSRFPPTSSRCRTDCPRGLREKELRSVRLLHLRWFVCLDSLRKNRLSGARSVPRACRQTDSAGSSAGSDRSSREHPRPCFARIRRHRRGTDRSLTWSRPLPFHRCNCRTRDRKCSSESGIGRWSPNSALWKYHHSCAPAHRFHPP